MKILVVQESDWENNGPHQSHHLVERLLQKNHEIRIIDFKIRWNETPDIGIINPRKERMVEPKIIKDSYIKVITPSLIRIPILDYLSSLYYQKKELNLQFNDFKPDIVIGLGIINSRLALSICQNMSIPFVYFVIDVLHRLVPQKQFQFFAKFVESSIMKNSNYVLSINEKLQDYTVAMGAPVDKTEVLSAGVDLNLYNNANGKKIRADCGFEDKDVILFFMGWFYNFSGLQEAVVQIYEGADESIKLLLIGKGDARLELEKLVSALNLESRVKIVDWVDFSKIPDYIAASDFCILPSHKNEIMNDIVPIKMYEYLASGKPVISTELDGIMKEFGYENGVHYIKNPAELIPAVVEIMEGGNYDNLSIAAKKFTQNSDWSVITAKFEERLLDLIENTNIKCK